MRRMGRGKGMRRVRDKGRKRSGMRRTRWVLRRRRREGGQTQWTSRPVVRADTTDVAVKAESEVTNGFAVFVLMSTATRIT